MQYIYHIPYSGNIEKIDAGKIQSYSVREEGKAAEIYHVQQDRVAHSGRDITVLAPAQAGGLIVKCSPKDAQAVYDSVFGGHVSAKQEKAALLQFPKNEEKSSPLQTAFGDAAARFHLGRDFGRAAQAPIAPSERGFTPSLLAA